MQRQAQGLRRLLRQEYIGPFHLRMFFALGEQLVAHQFLQVDLEGAGARQHLLSAPQRPQPAVEMGGEVVKVLGRAAGAGGDDADNRQQIFHLMGVAGCFLRTRHGGPKCEGLVHGSR